MLTAFPLVVETTIVVGIASKDSNVRENTDGHIDKMGYCYTIRCRSWYKINKCKRKGRGLSRDPLDCLVSDP